MYQISSLLSLAKVFYPKKPSSRPFVAFRNNLIFYGEEFLAPNPTPNLEDHPFSVIRDCLDNIFSATLHPQP